MAEVVDRGLGFGVGGDDRFVVRGEVEHGGIVKGEWGSENELIMAGFPEECLYFWVGIFIDYFSPSTRML